MPFLIQPTTTCSPLSTISPLQTSTQDSTNMFSRGASLKDKLFGRKSSRNGTFANSTSPTSTSYNSSPPTSLGARNPAPPTRRPNTTSATRAMPADEAPPAYQPPSTPASAAVSDSQFAFLAHFDTIFLIDDSGSMSGARWRETASAIAAITPTCTAHDADGIDVHFLNTPSQPSFSNLTDASAVQRIFETVRPAGGTPTGMRLHQILRPYLAKCFAAAEAGAGVESVKPLNIIVITDGEAGDDVETAIRVCASKLDRLDAPGWQVGIQFFQVGEDRDAQRALMELDDGLSQAGNVRDIVDTVPWRGESGRVGLDGEGILKVVLGAVNRRLDRKKVSLEMLRR